MPVHRRDVVWSEQAVIGHLQRPGVVLRVVFTPSKGERWQLIEREKVTHDVRSAGGNLRLKGRLIELRRGFGPDSVLSHIDYQLATPEEHGIIEPSLT